ncbi:MAG: DUF1836 domain-containing protein [Erysipelotrichaceae bacterium]|nr:DUF1836 domain-containing protein [Erysipelotrichaceae bacterium]
MKYITRERADAIKEFRLPAYKEIPDVGLYLDQTARYVDSCLSVFEGYSLTNSMISNYVKSRLISNPVKKQYYRDQIACLLFIALSKNVLSLDKVAMLLNDVDDVSGFYSKFSSLFEDSLHKVFSKNKPGSFKDDDLLNDVIITSVYQIYLNERMKDA